MSKSGQRNPEEKKEPAISPTLMKHVITPYLHEMKKLNPTLNHAYQQFHALLTKFDSEGDFIKRLQFLMAKGPKLIEAGKDQDYAFFHAPHAAEFANYVGGIMLARGKDPVTSCITAVAAAYADVAQSTHDLMENKIQSADEFSKDLISASIKLKNELILGKNKKDAEEINHAISQFIKIAPYLADQLIILPTYFVGEQNKSLLELILAQKSKEMEHTAFDGAQKILSVANASLSLFPEVLKQQYMSKNLNNLCEGSPEIKSVMSHLITELNLENPERLEGFLLRLTQDLNLFAERNKLLLMNSLKQMRSGATQTTLIPAPIFDTFLRDHEHEVNFALTHLNSAKMLDGVHMVNTTGWGDHIQDLKKFNAFCEKLSPTEKSILATSICFLTANTAGVALMTANKFAKEPILNRMGKKGLFVPAPSAPPEEAAAKKKDTPGKRH